ncbi:flagellar biosynthesis protein FlhF [Oryzisolibacter propanilivorax]|uniref:Flagellar biosynthesis protein FlhF n=1 Tax=Oryzisolibacter propanilivorax TaxID=1527607 RepID=A0A1G9V558_9BURK|nr:flagellar biosynthesis protein FlhF [Oryzisolibacter propanilivorax]SDM67302.1 flagellar biosynthesis protein FlhF [Oryzisolibacter propanilivorax]
MNIQRFTAPTAREALAKARMAFGDGTLILSNRPIPGGVEVMATAEESLSGLQDGQQVQVAQAAPAPARQPASRLQERADDLAASPVRQQQQPQPYALARQAGSAPTPVPARSAVAQDTEQLAMSTLSFQDYVRERMLRRRHEALHGSAPTPLDEPPAAPQRPAPRAMPRPAQPTFAESPQQQPQPAPVARHNPLRPPVMHAALGAEQIGTRRAAPPAPTLASGADQQHLMKELQSMKDLIEERFNTLSWLGQARQDPIQSNLMLKLIRAGLSPALSRAVLEHLPADLGAPEAVRWMMEVLERNLRTDAQALPLHEEGGIWALVGPTGVGKTTTTAKLAAQCARVHGPASVGLITLDTYRMGAHEQLRSYGRMLGVVAHLAHDQAALQDLLGLLANKKMVLIDTTGVAPRDPRRRDLLNVLDLPGVQRLLVLNAASHGDTLDDVFTGFKSAGTQQAILSKVDEAVKLGPAIDALIRHQMVLRGVTNGQRVPEDWEPASAHKLVAAAMRANVRSAFDPREVDLNFIFSPAAPAAGSERNLGHVA